LSGGFWLSHFDSPFSFVFLTIPAVIKFGDLADNVEDITIRDTFLKRVGQATLHLKEGNSPNQLRLSSVALKDTVNLLRKGLFPDSIAWIVDRLPIERYKSWQGSDKRELKEQLAVLQCLSNEDRDWVIDQLRDRIAGRAPLDGIPATPTWSLQDDEANNNN
jgi:hypothetical protein